MHLLSELTPKIKERIRVKIIHVLGMDKTRACDLVGSTNSAWFFYWGMKVVWWYVISITYCSIPNWRGIYFLPTYCLNLNKIMYTTFFPKQNILLAIKELFSRSFKKYIPLHFIVVYTYFFWSSIYLFIRSSIYLFSIWSMFIWEIMLGNILLNFKMYTECQLRGYIPLISKTVYIYWLQPTNYIPFFKVVYTLFQSGIYLFWQWTMFIQKRNICT
jgi:hypothetical protein